jgi:SAM-dependent methyltransferase
MVGEMDGYRPETYGDRVADVYDVWHPSADADLVDRLVELAGPGPVLELAIGTGRVALPLVEAGLEVHGVDASPAMIDRLRAKPGGDRIPVAIGNFVDPPVTGPFSMVYVVFNTFFALTSQQEQVSCFEAVSRLLGDAGRFIIEAFVPDVARFDRGQRVAVTRLTVATALLELSLHDPVDQTVASHLVDLEGTGPVLRPVYLRYAWPSELDLMARLAGLELEHRWGGWAGQPFDATSVTHVSVYRRG